MCRVFPLWELKKTFEFIYGRHCNVTTQWSHCKARLMVQIFRPEFVTSVSCTLFCGGNVSQAIKLSLLPAAIFEKSQHAGGLTLLLLEDVPHVSDLFRCRSIEIVYNEGSVKSRMYLDSLSVWYEPQHKVNIVSKQKSAKLLGGSLIAWLRKNNPSLNTCRQMPKILSDIWRIKQQVIWKQSYPSFPFKNRYFDWGRSTTCITKCDVLCLSERDALFKVVFHKKD